MKNYKNKLIVATNINDISDLRNEIKKPDTSNSIENNLNKYDKNIINICNTEIEDDTFIKDIAISILSSIKASFIECLRENKNANNEIIFNLSLEKIFSSIENILTRIMINKNCSTEEAVVLENTVGNLMRIVGADPDSDTTKRLAAMVLYICNLYSNN